MSCGCSEPFDCITHDLLTAKLAAPDFEGIRILLCEKSYAMLPLTEVEIKIFWIVGQNYEHKQVASYQKNLRL